MADILNRLRAATPEHPSIGLLREYIRDGFGFTATADFRRWNLSDKQMNALTTGFGALDDSRGSLIAVVQEAVGEIERLSRYLRAARSAESKMDVVAITDEAFGIFPRVHSPQESGHG